MPDPTRLLSPDDPDWDAWLRLAPHDFYHLASYHAFAERMGEGRAFMAVHGTADRFIAWPYLACGIDGGHKDANSVYGYTGPIGIGLGDPEFRAGAWEALRSVWADQGLVTLFTRFHPLLENDGVCDGFRGAADTPGGEVLQIGRSVSLDLRHDREERRRLYPQVLRQEIKAAERAGLVVEEDNGWLYYPEFVAFYRATMRKNGASDRYLFSDDYFRGLRQALAGNGHLAVARIEGGDAAAILLFTVCGDIAEAHLTGVNPAFHALSPLKALIDGTADLARWHGARRLHLGAGRGGREDSLYAFKSRFSPLRHSFKLGRWILDKDVHDALTGTRNADAAYFPSYRAPVPESASAS